MDSFEPCLDGYYDVADSLSRYLRRRAAGHLAAAREEKRTLDSREAFEARRDRVRQQFRDAVGGLADHPADRGIGATADAGTTGDSPADALAEPTGDSGPETAADPDATTTTVPDVETAGVLDREGYDVELVVVESLPDFHVTANCYVPDGDGPHPAVLFLCGHVGAAKADGDNQKACIELALNGFVVLAVDPVAQGEREQYRDPATGEAIVSGGGGVFAHCYAGQQCFYAGASLARFVVHDARRALDYLLARPDVDADRVGAVGTSGGGVQTRYLALVDDRLDAAAVCCAVTERGEWLRTGKRVDAEQVVPGAIPAGVDHDDFVAAMAPRPVLVGAAASDEYFPVEGVHGAVARVRRVYDLYDAAENVDLVVADRPHCSVYELGDDVFEWFCDHLGDGAYEPHDDLGVVEASALHCTPGGSVVAAVPDERTVDDLIREYVERIGDDSTAGPDRSSSGGEGRTPDDRSPDPAQLRRTVRDHFDLDRTGCDRHPRFVRRTETGGLTVEHVFFRTERDPDAVVAGVLVTDPGAGAEADSGTAAGPPAVVLYERGTEELPDRRDDVAALAAEHGTVLVFDPRGVGAVRNRPIPIPAWADDYYGVYGTEFKLASDALLVGTSLFGLRVFDVLRATEFLRSVVGGEKSGGAGAGSVGGRGGEGVGSVDGEDVTVGGGGDAAGEDAVALVGEGVGAYHALYAAVADGGVGSVTLRDLGPGFEAMATSREYPYDPRLTVFDVVGRCDVPQVLAALEAEGVAVETG